MDTLLTHIFRKINLLALQRSNANEFEVITDIPFGINSILPPHNNGTIKSFTSLPYLDNFLFSAEEHWQQPQNNELRSGPWIEINSSGFRFALEATALCVEGRSILLIEDLGEKFLLQSEQLQSARETILSHEQLELEIQKRTRKIVEREEQIALCLLSAAGYRDEETGSHIRRIGMYASILAHAFGWSESDVHRIRIAAPMHDIGKIGIPDSVLRKPGSLSTEEFEVMKQHTAIGADMLANTGIPMMDMASDIARCHHERWDGTGYPAGLKAEDIPLCARITTIVDIYDALVHERCYKEAMDEDKALDTMAAMAGNHIDPEIFQLFLTLLPAMRDVRENYKD